MTDPPDNDFLKLKEITSDASSDICVVSGYFPDSADSYICTFKLIATVTSIEDPKRAEIAVGTKTSFDAMEITVSPNADFFAPSASNFAKYVSYDKSKVNLNEVNSEYSVSVSVSADYDGMMEYYSRYIRSDSDYTVNIPEWMTYEIKGEQTTFNNEDMRADFEDNGGRALTHIVLRLNDKYDGEMLGELQDGTKARVNIPLVSRDEYGSPEIMLSWDVTYRKDPEPFAIYQAAGLIFTLQPGSKDQGVTQYVGSVPVSFESKDVSKDVKFTVTSTDIEANGKGHIFVDVEAERNARDGVYENVFTFKDAKGNTDALTVKVTVKKPAEPTPPAPAVKTITITGEPRAEYVYFALLAMRDDIKKMGSGTTFKEISGRVFSSVIIPLPPIDEQHKIVARLNELLPLCEALGKLS